MTPLRFFFFITSIVFFTSAVPLSFAKAQEEPSSKPLMMGSPEHYYHDALEAEARGDLADASLALRRALVLNPRFSQAEQKLSETLSKIGVPRHLTWKSKIAALCSPDLLVLMGSLLAWSAAFWSVWFFFVRFLHAKGSYRKKSGLLLTLILLLSCLGAALIFLGTIIDPRTRAVSTVILLPPYDLKTSSGNREDRPATTPLRATPVENATVLASIPTGSSLFLRSRHGVWSYVQLESGQKGWIASSVLQPLVPHLSLSQK